MRHERAVRPSSRIVQAPHTPCSQREMGAGKTEAVPQEIRERQPHLDLVLVALAVTVSAILRVSPIRRRSLMYPPAADARLGSRAQACSKARRAITDANCCR